ncbi:MAG: hypothetical protein ABSE52_05165 [Candidatus Dormibacteria bacterium]|jgi:hypothetical protein
MTLHTASFPTEPRVAAGYGTASRRAIALVVSLIAVLGALVVWGLSVLVG